MGEYKHVGNVPLEVEKGEKRVMLGPGETVSLAKDELDNESNQALIESGWLIEVEAPKKGK